MKIPFAHNQENSGSCITRLAWRRQQYTEILPKMVVLLTTRGNSTGLGFLRLLQELVGSASWLFFFNILLFLLTLLYEGTGIKEMYIPF